MAPAARDAQILEFLLADVLADVVVYLQLVAHQADQAAVAGLTKLEAAYGLPAYAQTFKRQPHE